MARRVGLRLVVVAMVFGGWVGAGLSGAAQAQSASIAVLVYNRAHMRQQTLRDGEEVGKGILARAGMASAWLNCLSESGESVQHCSNPHADGKLVITVIKRWKGTLKDDSRLGLAVQSGIMSAYWYKDEIEAARRGALAFTLEDITAMRRRFSVVSQSTAVPSPKPRT